MKRVWEARVGKVAMRVFLFCVFLYACGGLSWGAEEKPRYGGTLTYAIGAAPPSFDAHRESTYAVIHPIAPHYSLLVKFDQKNYPKVVGDLAESWTVSADSKTYTFKIHNGVKFHDGSLLTSKDIKASYDRIVFPPTGIVSARKAFYDVVEKIEAPDDHTVVFRLKRPSASFMISLASPWNWIYKADILAKDPRWYEKNVMGSGAFKFVEYVTGSHWVGKKHEDYFVKGRPYLDGYRAVFIRDVGARAAAIRGGRVQAEFRYFSPSIRDDLVRAMGDKVKVQELLGGSVNTVIFNCEAKPFNDPRVRRAMSLALDRWEGFKALERIAEVGTSITGLLSPASEFAMTDAELMQLAGFSKNGEASKKEARRLLKEAGVPEGFSIELLNRQEYEPMSIWLIDQWRQVGLNVTQKVQEVGAYYKALRSGEYKVAIHYISDYISDPDLLFLVWLSSDISPANFGRYIDRTLDDLYQKQSSTMNPVERKKLSRQFQTRVLDEMAYGFPPVGWTKRITIHSAKVKGWVALPHHFLNVDLVDVWL
ncbi:MAG TPA: ABC transporter substrate-binding protein, partial [Thermodesulfobacteriota bacterium]|nr:ABC transporter substrate-binding protein [Thermodesulfobacteriota bacterium]